MIEVDRNLGGHVISSSVRRAVSALALLTLLAGCGFPDRRHAAENIAATVRSMPGVADVESTYDTSFDGGAHFALAVDIADTATDAQAAAIGSTFADRIREGGFESFDVKLEIVFARRGSTDAGPESSATFEINKGNGPTSAQVADSLVLAHQLISSPALTAATVSRPHWSEATRTTEPQGITLTLRPNATDNDLAGLVRTHPELATATWSIALLAPRGQARTYLTYGQFPGERSRRAWNRIVAQIGVDGTASAWTYSSDSAGPQRTEARISIDTGDPRDPEDQHRARFAAAATTIAPLLGDLGTPTTTVISSKLQTVKLTVGGCSEPDAASMTSPLQAQLRAQYELC